MYFTDITLVLNEFSVTIVQWFYKILSEYVFVAIGFEIKHKTPLAFMFTLYAVLCNVDIVGFCISTS